MLTKEPIEFKSIDDTAASPLAKNCLNFLCERGFIDENYISVTNMKSTTGKK
jgi:hypothetical protein